MHCESRPGQTSYILPTSVMKAFQRLGGYCLPNIHTIYWKKHVTNLYARSLLHVPGPSLRHLHLASDHTQPHCYDPEELVSLQFPFSDASDAQTDVLELLARLRDNCPQLQTVTFKVLGAELYATDALSNAICSWFQLQTFQAPAVPINLSALKHLASLPSLHTLNISLETSLELVDDSLPALRSNMSPVFPCLRCLVANNIRADVCIQLLDAIQSCTLYNVSLLIAGHIPSEEIGNLCVALGRHPSSAVIAKLCIRSLTTLSRCMDPHQAHSEPHHHNPLMIPAKRVHSPLPSSAISPLLSLKSLQHVSLLGPCFASLDDSMVAQMAVAWPQLSTAHLCHAATDSAPTLAGLAALAQCKHLEVLSIPISDVDERAVAAAMAMRPARLFTPALEPEQRCPLRLLNVSSGWMSDGNAERTAAALSAWFPELGSVVFEDVHKRAGVRFRDYKTLQENTHRWHQAGLRIGTWVRIREQEQRWAGRRKLGSQEERSTTIM